MMLRRLYQRETCCALIAWLWINTSIAFAGDDPTPVPTQNPLVHEVVEPVGLADWPALARALKADKATQGRIVSFRELWLAKPESLAEPLSISGVVLRRFRRDPVGQFPALEELWVRTDDDHLVVVTNRSKPRDSQQVDVTAPGSAVDIVATYIRNVRYDAADEARVAPWLVARTIAASGSVFHELPGSAGAANKRPNYDLMVVLLGVITTSAVLRVVLLYARRTHRGGG